MLYLCIYLLVVGSTVFFCSINDQHFLGEFFLECSNQRNGWLGITIFLKQFKAILVQVEFLLVMENIVAFLLYFFL